MTLPAPYFDRMYAAGPDPWGFRDRWYEQRKRALTLAALPRPRFRRVFEPGCSLGVLSAELARRCDDLWACDVSAAAVGACAERLRGFPHATVWHGAVPGQWPTGSFDLVVLSEVAYYLSPEDLDRLAHRTLAALDDDGVVLACHWRHPVPDYPRTGDDAHAHLGAAFADLTRLVRHEEADLLLEVWARDPRSVAQREGLT
jgi:SAM-dependent methyltransferase